MATKRCMVHYRKLVRGENNDQFPDITLHEALSSALRH